MKTEKITISEKGIAPDQAAQFLLKLIENQITNYNEQQMIAWERNHRVSRKESDAKMAYLQEQKNKLKHLLKHQNTTSVDFIFSLDVMVRSTNSFESN